MASVTVSFFCVTNNPKSWCLKVGSMCSDSTGRLVSPRGSLTHLYKLLILPGLSHVLGGQLVIDWFRMASPRSIRLSSSGSPMLQQVQSSSHGGSRLLREGGGGGR